MGDSVLFTQVRLCLLSVQNLFISPICALSAGGGWRKRKKGKQKLLGLKCETMFRPSRRRISFRRRFRKWRSELTSKRPSWQSGKLRTALPALPDCCSGIYGTDTRRQKPGVSAREISRQRQETRAGNSTRG